MNEVNLNKIKMLIETQATRRLALFKYIIVYGSYSVSFPVAATSMLRESCAGNISYAFRYQRPGKFLIKFLDIPAWRT